jgi:hypothetical protein
MSKLINMKTIGMTAVSLSLLLGTFAAPASTAFAKAAFNKDRSVIGEGTVTRHRNINLTYDGGRVLFRYLQTHRLGNRSVSFRRIL